MKKSKYLMLMVCMLFGWIGVANSKILVISPHPDDDIITSAGVVYAATQRGEQVTVVYVTNGDASGISAGERRQVEAVNAQTSNLGTLESDLIFLGYPDSNLDTMYNLYPNESDRFLDATGGSTATYANHGLGHTDYHNFRYGEHANYNGFNLLKDLTDIINIQRPDHIVTVTKFGTHPDHRTTYNVTHDAILAVSATDPSYIPVLNTMMVWSVNPAIWPENANPQTYFNEPPDLASSTDLIWANRESLDVPLVMQTIDIDILNPKKQALIAHGMDTFIGRFLHKDEFFWQETLSGNNSPPRVDAGIDQTVTQGARVLLNGSNSSDPDGTVLSYQWRQIAGPTLTLANATTANPTFTAPTGLISEVTLVFELRVSDGRLNTLPDHVSVRVPGLEPAPFNISSLAIAKASSEDASTGQQAVKAIDNIVDGFPGDYTKEWATVGGLAGSWLELNWDAPYRLDRVVLFDRPNINDQITSAALIFSDGTSVEVGALDNAGAGVTVKLPSIVTTRVRLMINAVSGATQNIGLSEIKVYGVPQTGSNSAPIANAGPDQSVVSGASVTLDGRASSDPNGDPISYQWVRTAGPVVTLVGANTATPSFTAPTVTASTVFTFSLVVNDGHVNSVADLVNVTVNPVVSTAPIANLTPTSLTFGNQRVATNSAAQTVTLRNTGTGSLSIANVAITAQFAFTKTCGTSLSAGSSCQINVTFSPTVAGVVSGILTVTDNSNNTAGSTQVVSLSGTGVAASTAPVLTLVLRDDFNRANANNLGANWQQVSTNGVSVLRVDSNQATANLRNSTGYAYSNVIVGATQAARLTFANSTVNNTALFLKASGALGSSSGQLQNAIRVRYNDGNIRVSTTINGNSNQPNYTNVGSSISTGSSLVNGNSLMAAVDNAGIVWVWKVVGNSITLLTPTGVQLPNSALWTTGVGKVGMRLPDGARVDNFMAN
jgi:LmbE family N-acetylglucosaminyl deacetylase